MHDTPPTAPTTNNEDKKSFPTFSEAPTQQNPRNENFFVEVVKFALIALLIVVPTRLFIAQPFIVNGSSMDPTFASGQYLIIDEITYRWREPVRGEIVVFGFPQDPKKFFIKRIIGLPGETVSIDDNVIRIVNNDNPEGFILNEPYAKNSLVSGGRAMTVDLGAGEFFVAGDNRSASYDSRSWGPLAEKLIVGRALVRLFPFDAIAFEPGAYPHEQRAGR